MSGDEPGYSASREELDRLPFEVPSASQAGASARLLAERWHRENPEPQQDPALRSGSPADRHKAAVAAALREGNYILPEAAALNRLAASIPMGSSISWALHERGLPRQPVRSRSAESVLRRRI